MPCAALEHGIVRVSIGPQPRVIALDELMKQTQRIGIVVFSARTRKDETVLHFLVGPHAVMNGHLAEQVESPLCIRLHRAFAA